MSDKLGGEQRGTLVNTFGWKKGPVLYDSVPNQTMNTLGPILRSYLPTGTPLFTDEGYRWWPDRNHRMIRHNRKSKSKRYKWARNRWSDKGVNCQVAEGNNALLKKAFSSYGWIKPKYSQMYLDEFAFFKNLKFYGWDSLAEMHVQDTQGHQSPGEEPGTFREEPVRIGTGKSALIYLRQCTQTPKTSNK